MLQPPHMSTRHRTYTSTPYASTPSRLLIFPHSSSQINRALLDFDFEKVCSVSTSNINIYGCLVCGKYFQGRGRSSYAYAHSIHDDHHVFINLETTKVNFTSHTCSGDSPQWIIRSTYSQMAILYLIRHSKTLLSC